MGHRELLRRTLLADAGLSGLTGLLMIAAAGPLSALLGVPAALLLYAGISLLPFAALLVVLATRDTIAPWAVRAVIAANVLWAIDSIVLLFTGWVEPSVFGYAFIVAQAIIVGVVAEIQYVGLKGLTPSAA
jgi:hypothetical protein